MADLDDFMAQCAGDVVGTIIATQAFSLGPITRPCVIGPMVMTKSLKDSGLWNKVSNTLIFFRADFERLGLTDRSVGNVAGQSMRVMLIEDDLADPMISVHVMLSNNPR